MRNFMNTSLLNTIASYSYNMAQHDISQVSKANVYLKSVNRGYDSTGYSQYARGYKNAIICGKTCCNDKDAECKYE